MDSTLTSIKINKAKMLKLYGEKWLSIYEEKLKKLILTSPSKNLKARLVFNDNTGDLKVLLRKSMHTSIDTEESDFSRDLL